MLEIDMHGLKRLQNYVFLKRFITPQYIASKHQRNIIISIDFQAVNRS